MSAGDGGGVAGLIATVNVSEISDICMTVIARNRRAFLPFA